MSSITQAKAEAQKLIRRYNKLQAEAKQADSAEAARKAAEAEKLVSQISALQAAITKLQAKDKEGINKPSPTAATASPSKRGTDKAPEMFDGITAEEIKRAEAEKIALEARINRIETAQRKTREQIDQLTRAKQELARLKAEAEKNAAQERRAHDEKLQQELAKLIKKKEEEHFSLKQELEKIRQQAQKDAELLKLQRDAARAMMEKQQQIEREKRSSSRRFGSKGVFIGIGIGIAIVIVVVAAGLVIWLNPNLLGNLTAKVQPPPSTSTPTPSTVKPQPTPQSNPEPRPDPEDPDVVEVRAMGTARDRLAKGGQGPLMVKLPASNNFMMGSKTQIYSEERPRHKVMLESFYISKFEITFAEYDAFAAVTGQRLPEDKGWGRDNRPVINVSWDEAVEYTKWLTEQTGHQYRLPTEREWEYAATAGVSMNYWWGQQIGRDKANCAVCGSQWDGKQTAPVGSFPPNAFGLHDVIGNVLEWTSTCFRPSYQGSPAVGQNWEGGDCNRRIVRSSAFSTYEKDLRTTKRNKYSPTTRIDSLGFRVVRID